jgi:hypothetical protein
LKQGGNVSDREKGIPFDKQSHARDYIAREIVSNRLEGIAFEFGGEETQFAKRFGVRLAVDPGYAFSQRKIRPIHIARIRVLGEKIFVEQIVLGGDEIALFEGGHMRNFIARHFAGGQLSRRRETLRDAELPG